MECPEYFYDDKEPQLIRDFFRKYVKLSGDPWTGKTPTIIQWQEDLIKGFGWHDADGRPKHKILHCWLPKKNCKTPTGAILAVQQLLRWKGNQIVIISATTKQAGLMFDECAAIVEQSPELKKRLKVFYGKSEIRDRKYFGKIRVLACRPQVSGFNCSVICDEVAEWPKHCAQLVLDKIRQAGDSKPNSFQLFLSTAQEDKTHPGYDLYRLAKGVHAGEIKDRPDVLPIIYEVGEHQDYRDLDLIRAANPAVAAGIIDFEIIKRQLENIKTEPKTEAGFRIFRCNQWGVGQGDAWISGDKLDACEVEFNEDDLIDSDEIYFGIDYARKYDLAAYAIVAKKMIAGEEIFYVIPRFFIPALSAEMKEKTDATPYKEWEADKANNLTFTDGDVVDPRVLRKSLIADYEKFRPREIGFDPWGLEESRQILNDMGLPMVEVNQTSYKYTTPGTLRFERAIERGLLRYPKGNKLFRWNCTNVRCRKIGGSDLVAISKRLSTGRVDGVLATVIAMSRLVANEAPLSFGAC